MASQGLKILVVDCVEKEALPLGGVDGWFRAALNVGIVGVALETGLADEVVEVAVPLTQ